MSDQDYNLVLEKRASKHLAPDVSLKQLKRISQRALDGGRSRTWSLVSKIRLPEPENGDGEKRYIYRSTFKFERKGKKVDKAITDAQFETLAKMAAKAGNAHDWHVLNREVTADEKVTNPTPTAPLVFPADIAPHFVHIFDRNEQIGIVSQSIKVAIQSFFANRNHCVLYGPPGCGKSEILKTFKTMLGSDYVMEFDATSTTAAGARKELRESETVPPILICEEIEKTDESSLRWLLGVLDTRGEIRGCNYRDSSYARDAKLLCLATVNDMNKFKAVMSGALASRFSNKIRCPRPNRAVLERILHREITKLKGNVEWAKPSIDYCLDYEGTDDPRRAIAIALCGQDKLLSGEYQAWLRATSETPIKKIVKTEIPAFSFEGLF